MEFKYLEKTNYTVPVITNFMIPRNKQSRLDDQTSIRYNISIIYIIATTDGKGYS